MWQATRRVGLGTSFELGEKIKVSLWLAEAGLVRRGNESRSRSREVRSSALEERRRLMGEESEQTGSAREARGQCVHDLFWRVHVFDELLLFLRLVLRHDIPLRVL